MWRTCVHACVIRELSILFKIFANPLNTHDLYTHLFALIFAMWPMFLFIFTQAMWRDGKCPIHIFTQSHQSSLKSRGMRRTLI